MSVAGSRRRAFIPLALARCDGLVLASKLWVRPQAAARGMEEAKDF